MKISEINTLLNSILSKLNKAHTEIVQKQTELLNKITELETQILNADNVPEETLTLLNDIKNITETLDDVVPDAQSPQ